MIKFTRLLPAVVLIVLTPFFFIGGPGPSASPFFNAFWDCGHIVFFGLLAVLLVQKFSLTSWRAWLLLTLAVFVLGGSIEIVQAYTGRNGSWQDLLRDLTGIWLGLFLIDSKQIWARVGRFAALAVVAFNLFLVGWSGAGLWYAYQQFPQLGDFESPLSTIVVKGQVERSTDYKTSGDYSLKVQLNTRRYSGVTLNELVHDWSGYNYLEFDIYNPDELPLPMLVRVSDESHDAGSNAFTDRFNRHIHMQPGWNHVEISLSDIQHAPEHRQMNMAEIASIVIFANRLREPRLIYLDNLHLRK